MIHLNVGFITCAIALYPFNPTIATLPNYPLLFWQFFDVPFALLGDPVLSIPFAAYARTIIHPYSSRKKAEAPPRSRTLAKTRRKLFRVCSGGLNLI